MIYKYAAGAEDRHTQRRHRIVCTVRDNDNLKSCKYVCITTYQPDTKSDPNPNPNPNPTTKQHAIVDIELNIVTCPTYPDKFIRDNVVAPPVPTSVVIVTLPSLYASCGWERSGHPQLSCARLYRSGVLYDGPRPRPQSEDTSHSHEVYGRRRH